MYSLHLSPEQLQIREPVRDFVAQEIKPRALAPQRLEASARPILAEVLDQASQLGLRTLALSEEAGGAGADNLTCCIVTEELAVGDPDLAAVLAQTSTLAHALFDELMTQEQRARLLPAFLADQRHHLALAQHGACGALVLQDCGVPAENCLAADAALFDRAGRDIPQDAAINLGIGRAAYEAALDYAQLRVQGGRRIIEHQAIGAKLAEIAVRLEIARTAIWQAAWASDHAQAFADGSLPDLPLARMAKVFASQAIYQATKDAAECFGAMGVMRDMPLQKYVHDALTCLHSGESNDDARLR